MKNNLVLIGMPGAGKSTNGLLLAKALGKDFVDTDVLIQVREGKTLQQIMDDRDYLQLRKIEGLVLTHIDVDHAVIATGGSAVYSEKGMAHLKENGIIIYLETPLETLEQRIHDFEVRGIAKHPEQSFDDLFKERNKLYHQHADIVICCDQQSPEEVVSGVLDRLKSKA